MFSHRRCSLYQRAYWPGGKELVWRWVPPGGHSYDAAVEGGVNKLGVDEGEVGKLALVDVGDDQLVRRGQNRLRTREELVKILCCFTTHFGFEWWLDLPVL